MDVGCYCVSFSRFIAGIDPVEAYGAAVFGEQSHVDESFVGTLTYADGVLAQFDAGMTFAGMSNADIMGSKGHIAVPVPWKPGDEACFTVTVGGETREERVPGANPFSLEVENIQAVATGQAEPIVGREESIGNMRTICALLDSATGRRSISLP